MIDEELYQFATEELNSDRRNSELWNRACALARDDHDEARFLYTNLRVEELLEQKANGEPMPEMPESVKGAASVAFDLDAAPNADTSAPLGLGSALATDEQTLSSSNRAFNNDSSADLSEDLVMELENSNAANESADDALLPDPAQLAKEAEEEAKVTLDPLVFSSHDLGNDLDTVSDTDSDNDSPSSAAFDLDAASALNNVSEPLPAVDTDIASLAAQASERLRGDQAPSGEVALEDALDATTSMESTAFNTEALDSIVAETGAFEPISNTDTGAPATPLPEPSLDAGSAFGEADVIPESTSLNDNELAFLDASIEKGRDDVIDQQREVLHQKDALSEELERQADSFLPSDQSASVSPINESDLMPSTDDIGTINASSANIDAVAETVDASKMAAQASADELFSADDINQLSEQSSFSADSPFSADSSFSTDSIDDTSIDALANSGNVVSGAAQDFSTGLDDVVGDGLSENLGNGLGNGLSNGLSNGVSGLSDSVSSAAGGLTAGVSAGVAGAVAAGGATLATTAAMAKDQSTQISQDFSQPGAAVSFDNNSPALDQTELLSGKGRKYRVFSRGPDDNRAVKTGVNWAAMFFTLPWLLVKRMPLMAIVYALLWVVLIAGVLITGLQWIDAPKDAQTTLAIWPLAFAALAVIGLIVLPFFMANRWHAKSLLKRGYEEIALVRAKGPRGAIDRIMHIAS